MSDTIKTAGAQGAIFDWRKLREVHPAAELFPLMPEAELKELAEDIEKNGVSTRIVLWPDSSGKKWLLDGRNRLDALALLGLLTIEKGSLALKTRPHDHPFEFECWYQHSDPYALALSLNVHRRHLTPEQKRDLIAKLVKAKPGLSDRQLGKMAKASKNTVASVRTDLESRGQVDHVEKRKDSKGREQPAKKAKPNGRKTETTTGNGEPTESAAERGKHYGDYGEPEPAKPEKPAPARSVNAKDIAAEQFDAHILELTRITKGQKPQRFLKTVVPAEHLAKLTVFMAELVALSKLSTNATTEAA